MILWNKLAGGALVFNDTKLVHTFGGRVFSAAGVFVIDSLEQIITWLIVLFTVVITDLIFGCRKSIKTGVEVRFSRAVRATIGKLITYFSFVTMSVFIERASHIEGLAKWMCLFVCFIEITSIISNILKPKGYDVNFIRIFSMLVKKMFSIDKEYSEGVIIKTDKEEKK